MVAKAKNGRFTCRLHRIFCENFKRIRTEKRLTQHEVALRMNLAKQTITELERGRYIATLARVERAALALETSVKELMSGGLGHPAHSLETDENHKGVGG